MAPSTQWPVQRLKFVASVMPSNVDKLTDPDHVPVRLCNYVDVYKNDQITGDMEFMPASATPAQIARFALRGGDVLITKDSETPDDIAVPAYVDSSAAGVICGYHLALLRPIAGRTIGRYLFWAICSRPVSSAFSARAQGITRFGLTVGAMGDVPIPLPPPAEQRAIADFLDRETAKIDALIATQERLIALLDEKRQATITHAVTKGLDPNAPMKESGIEWLGEVPEGWERLRLKRVLCSSDYGISDALDAPDGVAVLRMSNIKGGQVVIDDLKYVSSVPGRLLLNSNDLLFNRTNSIDLVGQVGMMRQILDHDISFASYLVRLRTTIRARPAYLSYLLNHPELLRLVRSMAFAAIGQANLNPTRYAEIVLLLPAVAEQEAIVAYLDGETAKIDDLAAKAAQAIECLEERRAALITAAVTGQIDVTRPAITEAAE